MKVYVTHDRRGRIRALAVAAPDAEGGELQVSANAGEVVRAIDVPITTDHRDAHAFTAELARIAQEHRVDPRRGDLVKVDARRPRPSRRPRRR